MSHEKYYSDKTRIVYKTRIHLKKRDIPLPCTPVLKRYFDGLSQLQVIQDQFDVDLTGVLANLVLIVAFVNVT